MNSSTVVLIIMAIVTVKNITQAVRKELGINQGDLLEAKVERGKLTYPQIRD